MLELMDPRGEVAIEISKTAKRLKNLKDTTIALIDSTKTQADAVLDEVREKFIKLGVKEFIPIRKPRLSAPLPLDLMELAQKADAAVLATYD